MTATKRTVLSALVITGIVLAAWAIFNSRWLWRSYLLPPPVNFRENRDVSLALYPQAYRSACVFTNEGISAAVSPEAIGELRIRLRHHSVSGTFFVDPGRAEGERLTTDHRQMWELRRLQNYGFEIAQGGWAGDKPGFAAEGERIRLGREILTALGFEISGYRAPEETATVRTPGILDRLGYLYGSNYPFPPRTLRTLLGPGFGGDIYFPYHPEGPDYLGVVTHGDPLARPEQARRRFREVHRRGGVFVFKTSFDDFTEEGSLDRLSDFIRYLKQEDTWLCTLRELCRWWLAREKISIVTAWDGDNLDIRFSNATPFMMKNARIDFKARNPSSRTYRIIDSRGDVIAGGFIPDSRSLQVTFPPGLAPEE